MRWLAALLLALAAAGPAGAQQLVADLSQSRVSITASFSGSRILVFGAVREGGLQAEEPFDIIVTVKGPREPATVRKKERVAGIWVNTDAATISGPPTFYNVSTSRPLDQVLSPMTDLRYRITTPRSISATGLAGQVDDPERYTEALIRIRERDGSYTVDEGGVTLIGNTLFRADIDLPSNVVQGNYVARIFMLRNQKVAAIYTDVLGVQKVGLERWIYNLAQDQAALYGILSLAIAIAAGWVASAAFRYIRGS